MDPPSPSLMQIFPQQVFREEMCACFRSCRSNPRVVSLCKGIFHLYHPQPCVRFPGVVLCTIFPPYVLSLFLAPLHLIMRSFALLAAAAPLVLALPAPAPVAIPAPQALPLPQGVEKNPTTGLVNGLVNGVQDIGSVSSAVPAVISDVGGVLDSVGTVNRKSSTAQHRIH